MNMFIDVTYFAKGKWCNDDYRKNIFQAKVKYDSICIISDVRLVITATKEKIGSYFYIKLTTGDIFYVDSVYRDKFMDDISGVEKHKLESISHV